MSEIIIDSYLFRFNSYYEIYCKYLLLIIIYSFMLCLFSTLSIFIQKMRIYSKI